jgi:hypothetical protein
MSDAQDSGKRKRGGKIESDKPRCGAETRTADKHPCRKFLEEGQIRCKHHGGASPQAKRKAAERVLEAQVQHAIEGMDIVPVENPLKALSLLAGEILAWKDLTATHVASLKDKLRYEGEHAEQIRGEVLLYERSMDRAVAVLAQIARLKIDERLAAINEAQVQQMGRILEGALDALGMTYDQKRLAFAELSRLARKSVMAGLSAAG